MIGALLGGALLTISLFQNNVNTAIFTAWVTQDLIPKLLQNSVIVMDNATFHEAARYAKSYRICGSHPPLLATLFARFEPH